MKASGFGDGSNPVNRLHDRVVRLSELRSEGLRLVSTGDVKVVVGWHHHRTALLDEIGTWLEAKAPRQAELILWPSARRPENLSQARVELVRAAVGCRELELLVDQLLGPQGDALENPEALSPRVVAPQGPTYVGGGQRFQGAVILRRLMEAARHSLVVIDQYVDDGTFTLAAAVADGISRRFLSSDHPSVRQRVTKAWADWPPSWGGDNECRIGSRLPHLRLLFIDGAAYHVDASLKDFGSSLTSIRMLLTDELRQIDSEIESMWRQATPL